RELVLGRELALVPAAPALAADVVAGVDEDAVDPGTHARGALERPHAPIRPQERLLHGVLGIGRVAQDVVGDALHARPVAPVELLEEDALVRAGHARLLREVKPHEWVAGNGPVRRRVLPSVPHAWTEGPPGPLEKRPETLVFREQAAHGPAQGAGNAGQDGV